MKKAFVCVLLVAMILSGVYASTDYEDGYRQGYSDALAGKENYFDSIMKSNSGNYKINYFVDEFGDITTEGYITQKNLEFGSFSNSATTNSDIIWYLILTKEDIAFVIYEYGSYRVTGSSSFPTDYTLSMKTSDGKVQTFSCSNFSDRIYVNYKDHDRFMSTIFKDKIVKITLKEVSKYSSSSYNFGTVSFEGVEELYNSL